MFLPKIFAHSSAALVAILGIWFWFCLPEPLFDRPLAKELLDRQGQLIGGQVAIDGQWRFEGPDSIPVKFKTCLVQFEDQRFYHHPGIDVFALFRALKQNVHARKVVSGGSTLTMQVIRLIRSGKPRTLWEKLIELTWALRLECSSDKEAILHAYASHAPFGGNVVGLEAASWRYFDRPPSQLSWAESAVLAVLPNQPSMVRPGKHDAALKAKRNRVLRQLLTQGMLDSLDYILALDEPVPESPLPLPQIAPHFLQYTVQSGPDMHRISSTIDRSMQNKVNSLLAHYERELNGKEIHNAGVLITSVENNEVLAYAGNLPGAGTKYAGAVDCIQAMRSTGSILKPILTTAAFTRGLVHPQTLLPDVPVLINGYQPENFNLQYEGAVTVEEALKKSLNIPMVSLLRNYGVPNFLQDLRKSGFNSFPFTAEHYGLSLILGGGETSLWQLNRVYGAMARTLLHYTDHDAQYTREDWESSYGWSDPNGSTHPVHYQSDAVVWPAGAIWLSFNAMTTLTRPDEEGRWQQFPSQQMVAWKTGTSFGFRDAWAVGITPGYIISVWAGNADGEGRPGCTGIQAAAPLLFQIINNLPSSPWFTTPYDDLSSLILCSKSGLLPGPYCPTDTVWGLATMERMGACPYHHRIWVNPVTGKQVDKACYSGVPEASATFQLPPLQAYYYRRSHPEYQDPPPWQLGCGQDHQPMALIYPHASSQSIYLPVNANGNIQPLVLKATHEDPDAAIHWHLDGNYLGTTHRVHSLTVTLAKGNHLLVLLDDQGNQLTRSFSVK